jgi:hypothetical protein
MIFSRTITCVYSRLPCIFQALVYSNVILFVEYYSGTFFKWSFLIRHSQTLLKLQLCKHGHNFDPGYGERASVDSAHDRVLQVAKQLPFWAIS